MRRRSEWDFTEGRRTDDLTGWNFVVNNANTNDDSTYKRVTEEFIYDPTYHGKHVAGILAR